MFNRNIPSRLQNVAKYCITKCCKIGGLRNYQRGGNLKKGEVNFERGGSDPLETMDKFAGKLLVIQFHSVVSYVWGDLNESSNFCQCLIILNGAKFVYKQGQKFC